MDLDAAVDDSPEKGMTFVNPEMNEMDKRYMRQQCLGYAVQLTKNGNAESVITDAKSFEKYVMGTEAE